MSNYNIVDLDTFKYIIGRPYVSWKHLTGARCQSVEFVLNGLSLAMAVDTHIITSTYRMSHIFVTCLWKTLQCTKERGGSVVDS
ncbi:hypothetical protein GBA52_002080 [Prunus armeniaca]|nr:hypothetical protein GBA52_002080 [Prunus armeniaca]